MPSFGIRGLLCHVQTCYGLPHVSAMLAVIFGPANTFCSQSLSGISPGWKRRGTEARGLGTLWKMLGFLCVTATAWELGATEQSRERCSLPHSLGGVADKAAPSLLGLAQAEAGYRPCLNKPHCVFHPPYTSWPPMSRNWRLLAPGFHSASQATWRCFRYAKNFLKLGGAHSGSSARGEKRWQDIGEGREWITLDHHLIRLKDVQSGVWLCQGQ